MKAHVTMIAILAITASFVSANAQACETRDLIGSMLLAPGDEGFIAGTPIEEKDLPDFILNRSDTSKFEFGQGFSGLFK